MVSGDDGGGGVGGDGVLHRVLIQMVDWFGGG